MDWQTIISLMGTISTVIAAIISGCIALWTAHESRKASRELEADKTKYADELAAKQAEYAEDLATKKTELASQLEQYKRELDRQAKRAEARYKAESILLPRYYRILQKMKEQMKNFSEIVKDAAKGEESGKFEEKTREFTDLLGQLDSALQDNDFYLDEPIEKELVRIKAYIEVYYWSLINYITIISNPIVFIENAKAKEIDIKALKKGFEDNNKFLNDLIDVSITSLKEFLRGRKLSYSADGQEQADSGGES